MNVGEAVSEIEKICKSWYCRHFASNAKSIKASYGPSGLIIWTWEEATVMAKPFVVEHSPGKALWQYIVRGLSMLF